MASRGCALARTLSLACARFFSLSLSLPPSLPPSLLPSLLPPSLFLSLPLSLSTFLCLSFARALIPSLPLSFMTCGREWVPLGGRQLPAPAPTAHIHTLSLSLPRRSLSRAADIRQLHDLLHTTQLWNMAQPDTFRQNEMNQVQRVSTTNEGPGVVVGETINSDPAAWIHNAGAGDAANGLSQQVAVPRAPYSPASLAGDRQKRGHAAAGPCQALAGRWRCMR